MTVSAADLARMPWPARLAHERREVMVAATRTNVREARERAEAARKRERDLAAIRNEWAEPSIPYREHGVWYVRFGHTDVPFASQAEALLYRKHHTEGNQ